MKSKLRQFHSIQPDFTFINHGRNDMEAPHKGDLCTRVNLPDDIRGLTICVIFKGRDVAYGVARCEWKYPFNKKLARKVAIGRAKQALDRYWDNDVEDLKWWKQGIVIMAHRPTDRKEQFASASLFAEDLVKKLQLRTQELRSVFSRIRELRQPSQ